MPALTRPVGTVTIVAEAEATAAAGAAFPVCPAVGMGSPLLGDALEGGSLSALADRSRRVLDEAARGRDRR